MKRKYIITIAIIFLLILLIGTCSGWFTKDEGLKVAVEKPAKRTIAEMIPANGKIQPVTEVKLSPDVSGEIVELNVREGDKVERGQLLLKIKPDVYISLRDQAIASLNTNKARLAQAEARLTQAELTYNRNKTLYDQSAITLAEYENFQSELDVATKEVEAARFNVNNAQASLQKAEEDLSKTTVFAPMSGTVSLLSVEQGERVLGTVQMAGTEMLRIANLNAMEVLVEVNENDIIRVKMNDTAVVEIDAYPDRKFKGVVTQIANSAKNLTTTTTDQVTNFEVKVLLLPTEEELEGKEPPKFLPGMSASVSIQTRAVHDVLSLPIQAITTRTDLRPADTTKTENADNGISSMIFIIDSNSRVKVAKIQTGLQDNSYIEVIGISDTVDVVTAPYNAISRVLRNGSLVKVTPADKLFTGNGK
ncbi:MAG: efflux RND transporter periplasmic adaptor subunit [Prevotellaceae bacterium]|jgi:HlyD family secretion protein|nr:efflux RND transporter periplasmic adaptor subunit [Prevotellaceae bacterium]